MDQRSSELSEKERTRLGDKFDTRTFHDALLRNGSLPMAVLPGLFPPQ